MGKLSIIFFFVLYFGQTQPSRRSARMWAFAGTQTRQTAVTLGDVPSSPEGAGFSLGNMERSLQWSALEKLRPKQCTNGWGRKMKGETHEAHTRPTRGGHARARKKGNCVSSDSVFRERATYLSARFRNPHEVPSLAHPVVNHTSIGSKRIH